MDGKKNRVSCLLSMDFFLGIPVFFEMKLYYSSLVCPQFPCWSESTLMQSWCCDGLLPWLFPCPAHFSLRAGIPGEADAHGKQGELGCAAVWGRQAAASWCSPVVDSQR